MRLRYLTAAALSLSTVTLSAQSSRAARFMDNCDRNGNSRSEQFCEVRDFTLAALKGLVVDGRQNGGVTVHGWDQTGIQIVAMIQTQAESQSDAEAIAKQIRITADNGGVRATGPERNRRNESWSVSYEIWTPRATDLALTASNGGIAVDGVAGRMELETVNGGLSLTNVGGDVRGRTVNGGVTAELSGERWLGAGLDLKTSNGGVHITVPQNYSAQLETGTVNGGMDLGFPITIQGALGKQLTTQLGSGGPTIRAMTTNGGVSIKRR